MKRMLLGLACVALLFGCSPVEPPAEGSGGAAEVAAPESGATTPPDSAPPAQETTETVESLAAKYEEAKQAFDRSKTDEAKAAYVQATVKYGTAVMLGDLPPREKYPKALELYEEALEQDPDNAEAKTNRQLILDIYKSMGREPPKSKEE